MSKLQTITMLLKDINNLRAYRIILTQNSDDWMVAKLTEMGNLVIELGNNLVKTPQQFEDQPHPAAPYGWVFYGPDGEWHWSETYDHHESVTVQRPATAVEAALATKAWSEHPVSETLGVHARWDDQLVDGRVFQRLVYAAEIAVQELRQFGSPNSAKQAADELAEQTEQLTLSARAAEPETPQPTAPQPHLSFTLIPNQLIAEVLVDGRDAVSAIRCYSDDGNEAIARRLEQTIWKLGDRFEHTAQPDYSGPSLLDIMLAFFAEKQGCMSVDELASAVFEAATPELFYALAADRSDWEREGRPELNPLVVDDLEPGEPIINPNRVNDQPLTSEDVIDLIVKVLAIYGANIHNEGSLHPHPDVAETLFAVSHGFDKSEITIRSAGLDEQGED